MHACVLCVYRHTPLTLQIVFSSVFSRMKLTEAWHSKSFTKGCTANTQVDAGPWNSPDRSFLKPVYLWLSHCGLHTAVLIGFSGYFGVCDMSLNDLSSLD